MSGGINMRGIPGELAHFAPEEELTSFCEVDNPVADFFCYTLKYKIPLPATNAHAEQRPKPAPTVANLQKALRELRAHIGAPLPGVFRPLSAVLAKAREFFEPGDFALEFLEGAAAGDDLAMRKAVRGLLDPNSGDLRTNADPVN
jgi:hypothetical protein